VSDRRESATTLVPIGTGAVQSQPEVTQSDLPLDVARHMARERFLSVRLVGSGFDPHHRLREETRFRARGRTGGSSAVVRRRPLQHDRR